MSAPKRAADHYRAANETCARVILADIQRYGGPDSLVAVWARLFIERSQAQPTNAEAGPLFERWAA
jgi:hypothetical protein